MKRRLPDFKKKSKVNDDYYDLREDWVLIEASLAKQYGIRIRQSLDMPWTEFCTLVAGLMPDTPLGQIVSIRSEKNPAVIKKFNPEQKKIHMDWKSKQASQKLNDPEQLDKEINNFEKMFAKMFGDKGVKP